MTLEGALTVDLEDWQCALNPRREAGLSNRPQIDVDSLCSNAGILLDYLDRADAKATFFVPGEVARAAPGLVKELSGKRHEIASHSSVHLPVSWIPEQTFRKMLVDDISYLEALTGVRPRGFRAPYFSIRREHGLILKTLAELGFWYDSSVVPTWTPYWGIPSAPKEPYIVDYADVSRPDPRGDLLEIPISVWPTWKSLPGLPVGGGFYMRIWPSRILSAMLRQIVTNEGKLVLYIHPGNLESHKKRVSSPTIRDILSQYVVAERGMSSFRRMIEEFRFGTMDAVFDSEIEQVRGRGV